MSRLRAYLPAPVHEPLPYGLLSAATEVVYTDDTWENGISFATDICNIAVTIKDLCNPDVISTVVSPVSGASACYNDYYPFFVEATMTRSTLGFDVARAELTLAAMLELATVKGVEREFWTGAQAKAHNVSEPGNVYPNRYLANTDALDITPIPGTPVKVRYALALLEGALANCSMGSKGVIHADRTVASLLNGHDEDGVLTTSLGNKIVAGVGYTGSSPTGAAPSGSVRWMYATGPVAVVLGDPYTTPEDMRQAVNSSVNTVSFTMGRAAAATWDGCCHYAVLVDLSLDYA